jgi:predicted nucleic acid-binding protein
VIVADASVILEVLLRTPAAAAVEARIFTGETLHAPHVLDLEVAQVLRRYELRGELSARRGAEALADFADLTIERYPHHLFLGRIHELRHNLTSYDAAYITLAEALGAPLVTRDSRLGCVPGHGARVEVIG